MDERKLQIIQELMEQLQEEMQPSSDDFAERLGRAKPKVEVMSVEAEDPDMESAEEELGMDLDSDMEMGESPLHKAKVMGGEMEEGPEADLKRRLMKLRG